jgi:hypothetical protein
LHDPTGGGLLFDVGYGPSGSLQMRPTIEYPPYPNGNNGGFCEDIDPLWAWTYSVGDGARRLLSARSATTPAVSGSRSSQARGHGAGE